MKKQLLIIASILLATLSAGAGAQPALVYQVSLNGTVNTNNVPFSRSAILVLTSTITTTSTQNGVNPVDLALISGNPVIAPEPGAIQYFTNYALYKLLGGSSVSNSALDLAYVSLSGNCVTIQPDTNFLTGLNKNNPSKFTVSSSLLSSQVYYVLRDTMQVCTNDGWNTINGIINYWGSSFYGSPYASMPYKAIISGKYVRTINF